MELAYQDIGTGKPVIILHGLFGAAKNWNSIAKQMARKYRILTLDLRNHGRSPWCSSMSYPEMAQDIADFIIKNDLKNCALVGHSMGGKVAMTVALKFPDLVERLVVADMAPVKYPRTTFTAYVNALLGVDLTKITKRGDVDPLIADVVESQAVRNFLLGNLENTPEGFKWMVNLEVLRSEMMAIGGVPAITPTAQYVGPTLFIRGSESDYVQKSHYQFIKHLFPHSIIKAIDGAGHWLHAEKPHEFMKELDGFLS